MTDLWLAIGHHILVFGLAIMLGIEFAILRPGMGPADIRRIAGVDIGYGATAGLIVIVGSCRVIFGAKGYLYYFDNMWFWAKMASFAAIGLLSVPPTLLFRVWVGRLKTDANYLPPAQEVGDMQFYLRLELLFLIAVVAFAATMARYAG